MFVCLQLRPLPTGATGATGVFRAATGVAAAPQRGANPPFATEGRQGWVFYFTTTFFPFCIYTPLGNLKLET